MSTRIDLPSFTTRGVTYQLVVLDEPEVSTDPILLLFRGDEEEPLITVHLTPGAPCQESGIGTGIHITLPEEGEL